jgi:hypothetical protein
MEYKVGDVLIPNPSHWTKEFIEAGFKFKITRIHGGVFAGYWSFDQTMPSSVTSECMLGLCDESIIDRILEKYK